MNAGAVIYDLAVIGGGINGAGIARDAAGRGAKVALIEKGDLARGTSSASTKLIHGGLRYLEHYEFGLVRESLIERERLWRIAPHIIWPMRFILPHHNGLRPKWLLRLGLFIYDHLGGRKFLPAARSLNLRRDSAGTPLKPEFTSGFEYSDCWVDDARLVVLNVRDAANHGADIFTRTEVTKLDRIENHWQISLNEHPPLYARAIVNAGGPAVLDLLDRVAAHQRSEDETIRLVRGSHIVVKKIFDGPRAYFCQNEDGRIFFAIPYEEDFTLIGTTDADHKAGDPIIASAEEIAYLCDAAGDYFKMPVTPQDVIWSFAGVRPLVDDGNGKPEAASRGYHFDIDAPDGMTPILSVFGGKITTYRHLAEGAMAQLAPWLPQLKSPSWTASQPLPGGDFAMQGAADLTAKLIRDYPIIMPKNARRLIRSYGTKAWQIMGNAQSLEQLGTDFGHGLYKAEVDYLAHEEWARSAEDILWRRTKLGLHFTAPQVKTLENYLAKNV